MWMGGADSAADVHGRRAARRSRGFCGGGLGLGDEVASWIRASQWAQPRREREEGDSMRHGRVGTARHSTGEGCTGAAGAGRRGRPSAKKAAPRGGQGRRGHVGVAPGRAALERPAPGKTSGQRRCGS
ncbi:hypothetical protein E2562_026538 [Oryza meyeriana var. granulata]|uniref:Uncharacterized protein n=1 Tax=Oryza meyeriana var. granulata TaxID=110450 RepID=A0A6G1CTM9_9ORYZ|nr:hypothetical protein E2562_026538 [Oryza meyeriana var. granulata]